MLSRAAGFFQILAMIGYMSSNYSISSLVNGKYSPSLKRVRVYLFGNLRSYGLAYKDVCFLSGN